VFALLDNGDAIFESAGKDTLEFDEFIEVLWQYRATPAATLKCISDLRKYVFLRLSSMERTLNCVDNRLSALRFNTEVHPAEETSASPGDAAHVVDNAKTPSPSCDISMRPFRPVRTGDGG